MCRMELCTELFCAIIPTLFPCFYHRMQCWLGHVVLVRKCVRTTITCSVGQDMQCQDNHHMQCWFGHVQCQDNHHMSILKCCFPGNNSLVPMWPRNKAKATIALTSRFVRGLHSLEYSHFKKYFLHLFHCQTEFHLLV